MMVIRASRSKATFAYCLPVLIVMLLICTTASGFAHAGLTAENLRCEYKQDPLGIDSPHPRLFWRVSGAGRGRGQAAYQILVASSKRQINQDTGDLWDTGRVSSSETIQIPYQGKPLASGRQAFWKIRVWDEGGNVSRWSRTASWAAGLRSEVDWTAKWIGYSAAEKPGTPDITKARWIWHAADGAEPPAGKRWFRATLNLPTDIKITAASLAISADDRYTFTINGRAEHNGPQVADSWRRYQVFDIARDLRVGPNTILIEAENLTPGPAGVIASVTVTTSAETLSLSTDGNWESAAQMSGPFAPATVIGDFGTEPWGMLSSENMANRTPPPYFRKTFDLSRPVKRAVLYATALGVYELSLNGRPVSDDVLSPGWTDYRKRVHYLGYDVTRLLKPGPNTLGAILGDGWYASYLAFTGKHHFYGGEPKIRLQLEIEYRNGNRTSIGTDETWKTTYGPIKGADMLMGYTIDTREEMPGWNTPNFDDARWKPAIVQTAPALSVEAQPNEPIRPTRFLNARNRTEPKKGIYLYDLGQNMVGWVRLKINGQPGQKVTVRHGERLNPDGTLYTTNLRSAQATDTYILKGGRQNLEPKFTFHGFQYVEITGASPDVRDVVGIAAASDLTPTLTFESDNLLLNRLVQNIDWGFRGNSLDVPTDCPQRDERAGWMGDAQVFAKTAMFHRDAGAFYTKWLVDVEDGQFPDGSYPDVAPSILGGGNAAWEDAGVITAYRLYEMYGDTEVLRRHWASLTRFMEHLAAVAPEGVRSAGAYGDWLLLDGPQHSAIDGTAYYYRCATLMADMATALGKTDEATKYRALAERIRDAFRSRFLTPDGLVKDSDRESQTFYALALDWELLPEALRSRAAARLSEMLQQHGNHLTTGFIGTPVLLGALARSGSADEANALLLTETYPSWLYQVKIGATTMWERWDGWTPEKGFQDAGMNSFNHYWLGCVGEWIYTGLLGIDTEGPGWSKVVIHPHVSGSLQRVRGSYDSIRGRIESGWAKGKNGSLTMHIAVPANVTATVYVPAEDRQEVVTGDNGDGVTFLRKEGESLVYAVGSGVYTFRVEKTR